MLHWYAIQTKARQEQLALKNLERQNFHTFLPQLRNPKHVKGSWQERIEPMFPGYLFTQLDFSSQDVAPIRSTRGVLGFVRFGGVVATAPSGLVESLQELNTPNIKQLAQLFSKGEQVEVVDGAFAGLSGIVQAQTSLERVVILLELMGRKNEVSVATDHIIPAA